MTDGQNADWFLEVAEEETDAAHLAELAQMPEEAKVGSELRPLFVAFRQLSTERTFRMMIASTPMGGTIVTHHPDAIPFSAVNAFAQRYEISGEDFFVFYRMIEIMDDEFRKVTAEQQSAADG